MTFNNFPIKDPYEFELEQIMQHIVDCFNLMLTADKMLPNDENEIRSHLVEGYLKNAQIIKQIGIKDYMFDAEVGVFREIDFKQVGRSDIKVFLRSSTFAEPQKHFIIECKRLDGKTDLNREYVREGIMRFTEQYPTFLNLNGMMGFCIENFDIHTNSTKKINHHLDKWCPKENVKPLTQEVFIEDFEYSYTSTHRTTTTKKEFKLYHLMLEVRSIIQN